MVGIETHSLLRCRPQRRTLSYCPHFLEYNNHCLSSLLSLMQQRHCLHCRITFVLYFSRRHSPLSLATIRAFKYPPVLFSLPPSFPSSRQFHRTFQTSTHTSNAHHHSHNSGLSNPTQTTSSGTKHHHSSQVQDVFNHFHSLLLGTRVFCLHSSGPHGHGYASAIRQSRQQPPQCRWLKLPMQSHKQLWWNSHQHGCRRLAEALLFG